MLDWVKLGDINMPSDRMRLDVITLCEWMTLDVITLCEWMRLDVITLCEWMRLDVITLCEWMSSDSDAECVNTIWRCRATLRNLSSLSSPKRVSFCDVSSLTD